MSNWRAVFPQVGVVSRKPSDGEFRLTRIVDLPDLHIQTGFSDGSAPVQFYVEEAKRRGIKELGIADHYSLWHKMDTTSKFLRYLAELGQHRVYIGVEVDIGYELPLLPSMRKQLDFVMAGLHRLHGRRLFFIDSSSLGSPQRFVTEMMGVMVTSMEHHDFDVISHPTQLPPRFRSGAEKLITDKWVRNFVSAAATYDVAVEVNCGMKLPSEAFVKRCLREGVKIATESSAHVSAKVGYLDYAKQLIEKLEVEEDQIYRPRHLGKRIKCRAMMGRAELERKQLRPEIQVGANDLTPKDLEVAIFYQKEKEVGKRIIVPSGVYREVSRNILALDYVPDEVDIRLYEGGDRLDHLVLFRRETV